MTRRYAKGKRAWGECQRSGRRMLLKDMVADGYYPDLIVDPAWRDGPHPQEHLPGVHDSQTLYRPAPMDLPAPTPPDLTGDIIDETVFFVLGNDGGFAWQTSQDGVTFSPIAETALVRAIIYVPQLDRWFAVGTEIRYSNDGITWIQATVGFSNGQAIAYSPSLNVLVAVSSDGVIMFSNDGGFTWNESATYTSQTFRGVAWDATIGLFTVGASAGNPSTQRMQSSPDGDTWTLRTISSGAATLEVVGTQAGRFLQTHSLTALNAQQTSTNGTSWASAGTTPFSSASSIDFGLSLFMINGVDGSSNNVIQRSASGLGSWTTVVIGAAGTHGTSVNVRCDPTRNRWWHVARNRLHRSNDANGDAWTEVLSGSNLRCIGIRGT